MSSLHAYQEAIAHLAEGPSRYPEDRFAGHGVVTCGGGPLYFTCAHVLVRLLRKLGCDLPIEVWYRGRREMNPRMKRLLEQTPGVRCLDAQALQPDFELNGWEIKPYAIINSRFEHVLFIDADNAPVRDPSFLFDSQPYHQHGAVFWPDRWMGPGDDPEWRTLSEEAWRACGLTPRHEPEFESGQIVINKRRCWRPLQLALFLNAHSDTFYSLMLGDKDTFHLAWRRVGQSYAMPPFRPEQDGHGGLVLYQHDFSGQRLFQHRNADKWQYQGTNATIPGFQHEEACLAFRDELRTLWDGIVRRYPQEYSPAERSVYERLTAESLFGYSMGHNGSRLVELKNDFQVGLGKSDWETVWDVEERRDGDVVLVLSNHLRKMCILRQNGGTAWAGRCLHFDHAPMVLRPAHGLPARQRRAARQVRRLLHSLPRGGGPVGQALRRTSPFTYRRVGHDERLMDFADDHTIGRGAAGCERWWFVDPNGGCPRLLIVGDHGQTCVLNPGPNATWRGKWLQFEGMPVELIPRAHAASGPAPSYYARQAPSYY